MSTAAVRSAWLESLFGVDVCAAELRGAGDPQQLFPEERAGQERWVPKRVSEFAAGRQCAHLALRDLGIEPQPLLAQTDRRPRWPAGCVGSISHCAGFACAVVARDSTTRSLGVDAEPMDTLDESLWPRVLGEGERDWVSRQPAELQRRAATLVFSAKEAWYKCQFPVTGNWLEFHDARVTVSPASPGLETFDLHMESRGQTLLGRGAVRDGIVCTAFGWRC